MLMALSHQEQSKVSEAVKLLRDACVRITPQRQAILLYLVKTDKHPTADDIYQELSPIFPNISVATIYNNLKVFKKIALVRELTYGDASSRFEFITVPHYHVICSECGKISDFDADKEIKLNELAANETGFKIKNHRLEFYGICPKCQLKK